MARLGAALITRALGLFAYASLMAQDLLVRMTPDQIQVSAPKLHFLTGKPLDRLKSGNAVPFDFQLSILSDQKRLVLRQNLERFVISYDIWEEKFSVSRARGIKNSVSRLSALAAESWCLDNIALAGSGLPQNRQVWLRLDVRAQEARTTRPATEEEGLSLANLIEIFGRTSKQEGSQWRLEAGPLLLQDLRQAVGRTGT